MAWQTGTSTDWQDLLADLKTLAEANGWTTDRYATAVGGDTNVNEWIAHGNGGGSDAIYVGVRTFFNSSADARNWELAGFTGYVGANTWANQPGISPGRYDGATSAERSGAYVPLQNTTISYWFSVTSRRIIVVAKCGTSYQSLYMGWLNPHGTSNEYSYPLAIVGSTPTYDTRFNSLFLHHSGIADPQGNVSAENGPGLIRSPAGVWKSFQNAVISGSNRTAKNDYVFWPCQSPAVSATTILDPADRWQMSSGLKFSEIIPQANVGTAPTFKLYKSPDSGGDKAVLWPVTAMAAPDTNEHILLGELDDVFWVSASPGPTNSGMVSEDTVTIGADTYHVFQQANRTEEHNYFAVKQG